MKFILVLLAAISYGIPIHPDLPYTYSSVDFTNHDCTGVAFHAVAIHTAAPHKLTDRYEPAFGECVSFTGKSTLGVETIEDNLTKGERYLRTKIEQHGRTYYNYNMVNRCFKVDKGNPVFIMYQLCREMLKFKYFKDAECKSVLLVDETFSRELDENDVVFIA